MMAQVIQWIVVAVIAILIVGALNGCNTAPDMSRSEAINITNLALILEKHDERKLSKQ